MHACEYSRSTSSATVRGDAIFSPFHRCSARYTVMRGRGGKKESWPSECRRRADGVFETTVRVYFRIARLEDVFWGWIEAAEGFRGEACVEEGYVAEEGME